MFAFFGSNATMLYMSRIVFDIETVGADFTSLDEQAQEYLLKSAHTDEERALVPETLSFSPLTGQVVAIAMLNPDTQKGAVYYQAPNTEPVENDDNGIVYASGTEAEILEENNFVLRPVCNIQWALI